ncbi:MAG: DUF5067 domain-containing protein [Oscillospiraceae bacterium]|nr:DUF5067 domain-containing protein [Oscillospiraceae bacterium]
MKSCTKRVKDKWRCVRLICALLCLPIIMGACVGCVQSGPIKVGEVSAAGSVSEEEQTPQQTRFRVGEKAALDDVIVTLKSVSCNNGENFFRPDAGNVYVICEFEIENNSDEEVAVSSLVSFDAYVDDYSTTISLGATASADKNQLDGTVAPGKKMNGIIGYEVTKEWEELEITFTPDVWSRDKIVFVAVNE